MSAWVYIQTERAGYDAESGDCWGDLYTVGFYDPTGKWQPDSDHATQQAAAERVHYLNGGSDPKPAP